MVGTYNNRRAIPIQILFDNGIMTAANYRQLAVRNKVKTIRRACVNTPGLTDYDLLPERFRRKVEMEFPHLLNSTSISLIEKCIYQDTKAIEFYSSYLLTNGDSLPADAVTEYYNNAIILNALNEVLRTRKTMRKALNNSVSGLWNNIACTVQDLDRTKYPHTLPSNERRLKEKYNAYLNDGYQCLIHKNYCNNNARKVDSQLERLILSIYCMTNKPYSTWVQ